MMRHFAIKMWLSIVLLTTLSGQTVFAANKSNAVRVKITLASSELIENNHVGNEWVTEAKVNGIVIKEGDNRVLSLKPSSSLTLGAEAEEQDKIPDSGKAVKKVKASTLSGEKEYILNVSVVENRGRYSGNTAKWRFVFKVEKLK